MTTLERKNLKLQIKKAVRIGLDEKIRSCNVQYHFKNEDVITVTVIYGEYIIEQLQMTLFFDTFKNAYKVYDVSGKASMYALKKINTEILKCEVIK